MSFAEYFLVAVAVFCIVASLSLFMRAKSEQDSQHRAQEWVISSEGVQAAPPDRYGFRRMGHCLPWW